MKKTLIIPALITAIGVGTLPAYASADMSQHTNGNVYIEGNVAGYGEGSVDSVTLKLYDSTNDKLVYFDELAVGTDKSYSTKFNLNADATDLDVKIMYNGQNLNDTLKVARVGGVSSLVDARAVLINQNGKALELTDTEKPVHNYGSFKVGSTVTKPGLTYTSTIPYEDNTAAGVKVYLNNKFGYDVNYSVMLAYYDENGKMISVQDMKEAKADYSDFKNEAVITTTTNIPADAASVKAYVWYNGYSMIPFNNTETDKLESKTLYIVGDSTYCNYGNNSYPQAGVGMFIPDYFNTKYLTIVNKAVSGWTAKSFFDTGVWADITEALNPGDYVLITVGINDFGAYSAEKYQQYLDTMIRETESKGARVILGTAVGMYATRVNGYGVPYECGTATVERPIFEALKRIHPRVTIVDLAKEAVSRASKDTEIVGDGTLTDVQVQQNATKKYHLAPAYMDEWGLTAEELSVHQNGRLKSGMIDDCHINLRGADIYADVFADLIADSDIDLKDYLR